MTQNDGRDIDFEALFRKLEEVQALLEVRPGRRLSHREHLLMARLIPALVGQYGNSVFTVKELLENPVYRELTEMDCRELGTLFSKCRGEDFCGWRLERAGLDHSATLWGVSAC